MVFLFGLLLLFLPSILLGQEYPTKPINILITSPPGQIGDVTTRMLLGKAEKFLGQPFVCSNNNAGAGTVGLNLISKAKPDGYNILSVASAALVWVPHTRSVTYTLEDFQFIMHYNMMESGTVVRPDSPWKTFVEFVDYAKKNPGKITYGISGPGVPHHLAMEYVAKVEGIQWTAVPHPGTDPNMALLGGHISAVSSSSSWTPHVKAGKFRLLVVHSEKRMSEFPDVPTLRELGYDIVTEANGVILAPKETPLANVKKLDDALRKALDDKEYIEFMGKLGNKIAYRNHEELKKYLEESYDRVGRIVKQIGLAPTK
jgi:tripartite-type tricarboxylate transporter receptor subunit TctC